MSVVIGLLIMALVTAAYTAPATVALLRKAPDVAIVIVVNLLLGWTLVGWVVALCLALRTRRPAVYQVPPRHAQRAGRW